MGLSALLMTYSTDEIKALRAGIKPGEWGYTYDGSSDWTVGVKPDPQGEPVCHFWDRNDERAKVLAQFLAASPAIVDQLLPLAEENERLKAELKEGRALIKEALDIELRARAAEDVAKEKERKIHDLEKQHSGLSCKCIDPGEHATVDIDKRVAELRVEK